MKTTYAWVGDGLGSEQIGRDVNIDGQHGKVVSGSALFIEVAFEGIAFKQWWQRLFRRKETL